MAGADVAGECMLFRGERVSDSVAEPAFDCVDRGNERRCGISAATSEAAAAIGSASRNIGLGLWESSQCGSGSLPLGEMCPLFGVL